MTLRHKATAEDYDQLTMADQSQLLKEILQKLEALSEEDFFGWEGWQHFFGWEG